jgi:hypothetical protein
MKALTPSILLQIYIIKRCKPKEIQVLFSFLETNLQHSKNQRFGYNSYLD